MKTVGIDIGSLVTKIALLDDSNMIDYRIDRSTFDFKRIGHNLFDDILEKNNLKRADVYVMSTGYGRNSIDIADDRITEITAHAKGAQYFYPEAHSVIDIGGQDSKAIVISKKSGNVVDFQMNDKCAAGTGRFLEVMAHALEVKLEDMGRLSLQSSKKIEISSMCTVFAETEVVGLVAREERVEDIIAAIHYSLARRTANMVMRIGIKEKVMMTGGVAKNIGILHYLKDFIGVPLIVSENPQIVGAVGAALISLERIRG